MYGSFSVSIFKNLDLIQNACCRLILGARRSSPVLSIQSEACIPPLYLRRGLLLVKALVKLRYKPKNNANVKRLNVKNGIGLCGGFPVNTFMTRAMTWLNIFNLGIKRVSTETTMNIPPCADSSVKNVISHIMTLLCTIM